MPICEHSRTTQYIDSRSSKKESRSLSSILMEEQIAANMLALAGMYPVDLSLPGTHRMCGVYGELKQRLELAAGLLA